MRDHSRSFFLFFLLTLAAVLATPAPATVHQWSQSFGDESGQSADDVVVDEAGYAITIGGFSGSVDFGGGPLIGAGLGDIFVAKHGPDGSHVWSLGFGDADIDNANAVDVDGAGNVIVTGDFCDSVDFGGGPLTSAGDGDVFLAKFSPLGVHLWSARFGGVEWDQAADVAVDEAGNIFVTGIFLEETDLGGGPLTSTGKYDIFLAKFTADGAHVWSKSFGGSDTDRARALALDGSGNPILAGEFYGHANFGGGALHSAGGSDIFLAKFTADGVHMWSQSHGDTGTDWVFDLDLDSTDAVLLTGGFGSDLLGKSITFAPLPPLTTAGGHDVFLAKLSPSGAGIWSLSFGDGSDDQGYRITVDDYDDVITAGRFQGSIDFGLGPLVSAGDWDVYLAKFDGDGSVRWAESFGDPDYQWLRGLATDANRDILVAGYFASSIDFGGGPLTSSGSYDVFLAKLTDTDLPDAAIGDRVWEDTNGDGIQDTGEAGMEGVSVELYDEIGSLLDYALTETDGRYRFDDLTWGQTYRLRFFLPVSYEFSPRDQGSDDERDSDADPADGYTSLFTLDGASDGTSWDAGMTPPTKGGGGGGGGPGQGGPPSAR